MQKKTPTTIHIIPPTTIRKGDGGDDSTSKEYHLPSTSARAFNVE